ncbi:MAG: hypothetical protein ABSD62_13850 [Candidatus Limnocylindrales bacterium]
MCPSRGLVIDPVGLNVPERAVASVDVGVAIGIAVAVATEVVAPDWQPAATSVAARTTAGGNDASFNIRRSVRMASIP